MSKKRFLLPLVAGVLALAACSDTGTTTGTSGETSRVSLLLTDAPGDLQAAVVTLDAFSATLTSAAGGGPRTAALAGQPPSLRRRRPRHVPVRRA